MILKSETVAIGWCDNGQTDGKFTEGLMAAVIGGAANGMPIYTSIRVQGNQIGRQRQALFDYWADTAKTDWLLWVDSDIVLNLEVMQKLWKTVDKISKPVVSGVYFISKDNEGTLLAPYPCLFNNVDGDIHKVQYIHPLPMNQVIQVDNAGFGLVLMHKSIVPKMRAAHPGKGMFMETGDGIDDHFIGEDIIFFRRMKEAGVPLYANTSALVKHMKRFSLDIDYYGMYWTNQQLMKQLQEKQSN